MPDRRTASARGRHGLAMLMRTAARLNAVTPRMFMIVAANAIPATVGHTHVHRRRILCIAFGSSLAEWLRTTVEREPAGREEILDGTDYRVHVIQGVFAEPAAEGTGVTIPAS